MSVTGKIFAIKKYSLHDGPGIRTTVFLKGCPLNCWWCHNPEGINIEPEFIYILQKCLRCGDCIPACPQHAIQMQDLIPRTNPTLCELCGSCLEYCPTDAREIVGEDMSVDQLMQEIEDDTVFYDESGGGVTFSGGEPLLQPQFLEAALRECRRRSIHTALDTSGFAEPTVFAKLIEFVDLFLYDIKMIDEQRHRKFTGVSNKPILSNLQMLVATGKRVIVRIPLVSGINDDDENITAIAEYLIASGGIERVDLLPFHAESTEKYNRLSRNIQLKNTRPPLNGEVENIKEKLESVGLTVVIGG